MSEHGKEHAVSRQLEGFHLGGHHSNPVNPIIPILSKQSATYGFGRMDSDHYVVERTLNIDNQAILPTSTFETMFQLSNVAFEMTVENFTRVWQTLLLRRAQDIQSYVTAAPPPNEIYIDPYIPVPAPLYYTLESMGIYHSSVDGIKYTTVPPARPVNDYPQYWDVDDDLINSWTRLAARTQPKYEYHEYPDPAEVEDRPLILCQHAIADDLITTRAFTNETTANEAIIASVNDQLYAEGHVTYNTCQFNIVTRARLSNLVSTFTQSYAKDATS